MESSLYILLYLSSNSVELAVYAGPDPALCRQLAVHAGPDPVVGIQLAVTRGLTLQSLSIRLPTLGSTLQSWVLHLSSQQHLCFPPVFPHLHCGTVMRFPEGDKIGDFFQRKSTTSSIIIVLFKMYLFEQ